MDDGGEGQQELSLVEMLVGQLLLFSHFLTRQRRRWWVVGCGVWRNPGASDLLLSVSEQKLGPLVCARGGERKTRFNCSIRAGITCI